MKAQETRQEALKKKIKESGMNTTEGVIVYKDKDLYRDVMWEDGN